MTPDRRSSRRQAGPGDRGQSVFDYSIGISLFIVIVIGVLLFVPTAFGSFDSETTGGSNDALSAERAADHLVGSAFASTDSGPAFRTSCLLLFFHGSTTHSEIAATPESCGYEPGDAVAGNASLESYRPINVTVERNVTGGPEREQLCWDADANTTRPTAHPDCGDPDDVPLTAGTSATRNVDYAVAERYARFDGRGVYVVVRVW